MKKGFTLAELLCVIIILGILVALAVPNIMNLINDEKGSISDALENVIVQDAELYIQNNKEFYTRTEGNVYCITFQMLIDAELLSDPIIDPVTKDEISSNKYVKTSVENDEFKYVISDECKEINNE